MKKACILPLPLLAGIGFIAIANLAFAAEQPPTDETHLPKGWIIKGAQPEKYDMGLDSSMLHDGKPCAYIKSKFDKMDAALGTLRQAISAKKFIGKRIRFSGWLKTENVKDAAGLWVRVDGPEHKMLEFDNMENRPVKGSTDWQKYSCVVDVPEGAEAILFGFLLSETGKVWANRMNLDVVSKDVPSTNIAPPPEKLPEEPVNLDFSESK